mmetsp:Transcript_30883/g.89926  ORF Transcript_30883/g.89926 Transcript_30883/m.89926 type:complete len:279 (-) Transcript_30883:334-1170(-)
MEVWRRPTEQKRRGAPPERALPKRSAVRRWRPVASERPADGRRAWALLRAARGGRERTNGLHRESVQLRRRGDDAPGAVMRQFGNVHDGRVRQVLRRHHKQQGDVLLALRACSGGLQRGHPSAELLRGALVENVPDVMHQPTLFFEWPDLHQLGPPLEEQPACRGHVAMPLRRRRAVVLFDTGRWEPHDAAALLVLQDAAEPDHRRAVPPAAEAPFERVLIELARASVCVRDMGHHDDAQHVVAQTCRITVGSAFVGANVLDRPCVLEAVDARVPHAP